jgi:hypothetical protein
MTAGQKAMAWAFIYPAAKHGGARTKGASSNLELEKARISEARAIYQWSRTKAADVLSGAASPVMAAGFRGLSASSGGRK